MSGEGCKRLIEGAQEAATALGWKSTIIDPAGDPTKTVNALEQALTLKPDVVVTGGIQYSTIKGTLEEVEAAGIKVVATGGVEGAENFSASIPEAHPTLGTGMAAYVALASGGTAKIAMFELTGFLATSQRSTAFKANLAKWCPKCTIEVEQQYAITDLGTTLTSTIKAALEAHPDVNWVHMDFDGGAAVAVPAIDELGLPAGSISVVGYDGDLQNLDFIRKGDDQVASYGQANEWEGWGAIYAANELLQGQTPEQYQPGSRLLTLATLPSAGQNWTGDTDFRSAYKKLWGLPS
jgi:ribose transport system substrate-binding protein